MMPSAVALLEGCSVAGPLAALTEDCRPERDSRRVLAGDLFFTWAAGSDRDRHVAEAVSAGATGVVSDGPVVSSVPVLIVADVRQAYARACIRHHGLLEAHPPLLGVTGTDGKTSVSWMMWQLLGQGAARVGTLGWHDGQADRPSAHTTPPADELCGFLASLPTSCPGVALELSSHALDQGRLGDLPLGALVITGIGCDHLDYHGDEASYLAAKLRAIDALAPAAPVIVNADDACAAAVRERAAQLGRPCIGLGWQQGEWRCSDDGVQGPAGRFACRSPAPGRFNQWNLAAAVLAVRAIGLDPLVHLAAVTVVPGRLEPLGQKPLVYVDYAHTAEAIERVLTALRQAHGDRQLVCVFGCGGDRDAGKRGPMGRAALAADVVILTADNPRSESQAAIAADVLAGVGDAAARIDCIEDRRQAIARAIAKAGADGVVVVCGKGHETEQIIGDQRLPFDDRAVIRAIIAEGVG